MNDGQICTKSNNSLGFSVPLVCFWFTGNRQFLKWEVIRGDVKTLTLIAVYYLYIFIQQIMLPLLFLQLLQK